MQLDFTGKAVLITGAGAGIGEACANMFARSGAAVAVNSITTSAQRVADALTDEGRRALFVQGDVASEEDVQGMLAQTVQAFGRLDVLVNAAGIVEGGDVEQTSLAAWNRAMAVNAGGVFLTCKYALAHLRKTKGVIVNVGSLVATKGIANRAAYSASKGAVLSLSRAMAADCLPAGVRVNCVSPGTIITPSFRQRVAQSENPEQALRDFTARQPMGRLGTAEEIAAAVLFAACEQAAFLDGANIQIDGGASM